MVKDLNKKTFNIIDLLKYNPIKINQELKRTNYTYDVGGFLNDINKLNNEKKGD